MDAVERFTVEHFALNGLSDDRRRRVVKTLRELETFASVPLAEVTAEHVRLYYAELLGQGYHVNTVRNVQGRIRPFFAWALREDLADAKVVMAVRDIPPPRGSTNNALPRPYNRKELDRFWRELEQRWPIDDAGHWSNRWVRGLSPYRRVWPHATRLQLEAIVHLALHSGLRRDEIHRASVDDIHYDNAYVVVHGAAKGRNAGGGHKMREVPHTEASRRAVWRWLEFRATMLRAFGMEDHGSPWLVLHPAATPNNPHLPSSPAAPMRHRALAVALATVGGWELHRLRHTCGTEWLRAGMELEKVQVLLGHATLQQTLGYAKVVKADIHRSARRVEGEFTQAVGA